MTHAPFTAFVAPARRRPQIWRVLLGCVVVVAVMALWGGASFGVLVWAFGMPGALDWLAGLAEPTTPAVTLLLLSTFFGMALGTIAAAKLLHGRGLASLIGPGRAALRDFGIATGVVAVFYAGSIGLWSVTATPEPNLPPGLWAMVLPVAIVLIVVQTGAEELLFRGYLMQQIAARFGIRALSYIVPSAIFGLLHLDPATMGGNAWVIVASTTLVGLIAADLTYVSGTLGAAWGLHFANNVAALTVVATKGTITGLSLYLTPYAADDLSPYLLGVDAVVLLAVWLVLRRLLRR